MAEGPAVISDRGPHLPGLLLLTPLPSPVSCLLGTQSTCCHLPSGAVRLQVLKGAPLTAGCPATTPLQPPCQRATWNEAAVSRGRSRDRKQGLGFYSPSQISFAAPFPVQGVSHFPLSSSLLASIRPECSEQGLDSGDIPKRPAGTVGFCSA